MWGGLTAQQAAAELAEARADARVRGARVVRRPQGLRQGASGEGWG